MSNLFELVGKRLELQTRLETMNFDEETIQDTLEGESGEITAKIESYGFVIRNRNAFADAMSNEIERMTARRDAEVKRIAAIEEWLLNSMVACNINKIECPAFSVSVRVNPPSVDVLDKSAIPADYMRLPEPNPPVAAPDKKLILTALKDGFEVSGCAIKRTNKLVIK